MSVFQILALLFALIMLYFIRVQSYKKILNAIELGMWYAVWIIFSLLALRPSLLTGIVSLFHFTRVFDLLTVLAFMILISLITINYITIKSLQKQIEILVRQIAIKNTTKRNQQSKTQSSKND